MAGFFVFGGGIKMSEIIYRNLDIKSASEKELESILDEVVKGIKKTDLSSAEKMQKRLDDKIKPIRSLGVLEEIAVQMAAIQRTSHPKINGKAVLLMAGDHGVVKEGVSAATQEITLQLFYSYLNGVGGINVLANHAGAKLICNNIGMVSPMAPEYMVNHIKNGTENIAEGPAMTRREMLQGLLTGAKIASDAIESGINLLASGEVGIGNTTPSSAIISVITGCAVEESTGSGTGLKSDALKHKQTIIKKAIEINAPDPSDPKDILTKIGGLEIAAMVGAMLEAAHQNVPTIIDGIISSSAALIAAKFNPLTDRKSTRLNSSH